MEKSKNMAVNRRFDTRESHKKNQPKAWHNGISHWQNFGLLIFANFGLPVSFVHCLETGKCYCLKEVHVPAGVLAIKFLFQGNSLSGLLHRS